MTILTDGLFFDVRERKAEPPKKQERVSSVIVIPAKDPKTDAREFERIKER